MKGHERLAIGTSRTVHAIFEQKAKAHSHAPAVYRPDGDCWSYSRLNSFANRVAHSLIRRGLKPEQPVGVCMQRSPETVGVLLGILKARGAYVPLDVSLPPERLRYIAGDAMLREIFVDAPGAAKLSQAALDSIEMLSSAPSDRLPDHSPQLPGSEHNLLTLLYTSGSTGKPKGVMLDHASALRLVVGTKWLAFSPSDIFLQISALSFDPSTFELWGPLLNGGSVVTAPPSPSIGEIEHLLETFGVTTLWLTSGLFNVVMEERPAAIRNLKYLLTGGDVVSPRHARVALQHLTRGELINCYGPTENATFSTCHRVKRSDTEQLSLPIGLPLDNSPVYVLDGSLKPVRNFQVGEIFVGGEGLSRGYWNRPELTAQKFVSVEVEPNVSIRLYRTGDLGRYNRAGLLEFVGRTDFQVKIRGFRVEPEEIELALCSMPAIALAAVVATGASAESKVLCCAYIQDGTGCITADAIKMYLKRLFPDYMVPAIYKEVAALPRNTNDKVDRKALAALFASDAKSSSCTDGQSRAAATSSRAAEARMPDRLGRTLRNIGSLFRFHDREAYAHRGDQTRLPGR